MSHWVATKTTMALKLFAVTIAQSMEKARMSDTKKEPNGKICLFSK